MTPSAVALETRVIGLGPEAIDYTEAWELQRATHAQVVAGAPDVVLLLEHPPVYTAGRRTVRRIESMIIEVCSDFGLSTDRIPGRSGVWVPADTRGPDRKIAAIGIRVANGVTMHGFAINCDCDLTWFDRIVPCGIRDASVTSLSSELGREVPVPEVLDVLVPRLGLLRA